MLKHLKGILLTTLLICLFFLPIYGQRFNPPEWSYDKAIYEVNVRQYSEEGTFKAFEKHLFTQSVTT